MSTLEKLIEVVKQDSEKALGCTEPVAVGYCANVCNSYLGAGENEKIESVEVRTSKNIFKNGKAVYIPVVKETGLDLAAALGICLLYTSPSPRDRTRSRMPSSA